MDLYINKRKIVLTGSIVSTGDEPIMFDIADDFVVVFQFEHDSASNTKQCASFVKDGRLYITFTNYEDPLFTSNAEPMLIGHIKGHQIVMNYAFAFVGDLAKHTRIINYTFSEILSEARS